MPELKHMKTCNFLHRSKFRKNNRKKVKKDSEKKIDACDRAPGQRLSICGKIVFDPFLLHLFPLSTFHPPRIFYHMYLQKHRIREFFTCPVIRFFQNKY